LTTVSKGVKRWLRHAPAVLGVALLIGAIYVVQREFRHLKVADIARALAAIPRRDLLYSAGWTLLAYGVLTFYDKLATIYARHKVSFRRTAFASFCAYALSHNLGFAAVSGAAVRYRLYAHWGLTPLQIGKVVAFCSLTFGLGGMVLGGLILFTEPDAVPFFGTHLPRWALGAVGAGLWCVVAAYVTLARVFGTVRFGGNEVQLPGWRMAVVQVLLATVDVAVTAAIGYALVSHAHGLTYPRFLAVYLASYTAGLVASLPGGLGVFDTAMLLGLEPYLSAPQILGAVAVFRLYYYVIPLFLAGSLFAGNEILLRGRTMLRRPVAGVPAKPSRLRWSEPDFAAAASTGVVALCGAMLLSLGVFNPPPAFSWIEPDFFQLVANAGNYVPSLIGTALMVFAIGLAQRVTLAWGATIVLLLAGAVATWMQDAPIWVSGVLVLATLLIAPFRDAYYRHAWLLSGPTRASTIVPLFGLATAVLWLAAFEPRVRYLAETSWWKIVLSPDVPNGVRAAMGLAVGLALVALWGVIRPGKVAWLPWAEGRSRYAALGATPPAEADGLVLGEAGRAGIPFRRIGRVLLGLGDPAGSESDRVSAIWRLRDLAAQEGQDAAVWQAGPELLKVYGDLGLTALPLGPDGAPLPEGSSDTAPARRYLCCVAERDLSVLLPLLPALAGNGVGN